MIQKKNCSRGLDVLIQRLKALKKGRGFLQKGRKIGMGVETIIEFVPSFCISKNEHMIKNFRAILRKSGIERMNYKYLSDFYHRTSETVWSGALPDQKCAFIRKEQKALFPSQDMFRYEGDTCFFS
jgi:hypothetical protein